MYTAQCLYFFVSCETFQVCSNSMVKYDKSDLESLLKKSSRMLNFHLYCDDSDIIETIF